MVEKSTSATESSSKGDSSRTEESLGKEVYVQDPVLKQTFSLDDARKLSSPTDKILCTLADN